MEHVYGVVTVYEIVTVMRRQLAMRVVKKVMQEDFAITVSFCCVKCHSKKTCVSWVNSISEIFYSIIQIQSLQYTWYVDTVSMYICTIDSQPQVIKFTSCLHMVGGSLRLLPPLKLVAMIYEMLLKVALITINQSTSHICNVYFFVQLIYYNGCLFFVCIFDFFAGGVLFLFWCFVSFFYFCFCLI